MDLEPLSGLFELVGNDAAEVVEGMEVALIGHSY